MRRLTTPLLVLACLLAGVAPAAAAPVTTVDRTIRDCDGDNLLEPAPGEPIAVDGTRGGGGGPACRPDRSGERPLRLPQTASVLNFLQLTDFQTVDEESPGRVEFIDGTQRAPFLQPFSAAYRPQESLSTQVVESMVRQARNTVSPVTGARLNLTMLTGDNADSQQFNETRWFIDLLDGTAGPGDPDPEMDTTPGADRKINPDSGIPVPGCEATPGSVYDGVRDSGSAGPDLGYYEPDASGSAGPDGDGYSPNRADNVRDTGRDVTVRDFPGLLERAQQPFEALGLGMPWYSAFGNHDALIQGNSPDAYEGPLGGPTTEAFSPLFNGIATGCAKVLQPSATATTELKDQAAALAAAGTPAEAEAAIAATGQTALDVLRNPGAGAVVDTVPPDPRRCYVAKDEPNVPAPGTPCSTGSWIRQHFRTTGTPVGHGFAPSLAADCEKYGTDRPACMAARRDQVGDDPTLGRPPSAVANHDGYYSFRPRPGFRFVVLDSITDECGAPVCAEGSIDDAQFQWLRGQLASGDYVVTFSHHTLPTMREPSTDQTEQPLHFGTRQANPASPGETLQELFCEFPNALFNVSGHEHVNRVSTFNCPTRRPFYEITTASHMDWPQQARMIELVNLGGQLAVDTAVLDHDGAPNPGNGVASDQVSRLASIARELAYNDPQGTRGAEGGREDRNRLIQLGVPAPPS